MMIAIATRCSLNDDGDGNVKVFVGLGEYMYIYVPSRQDWAQNKQS
jgi:hypothetical protein